MRRAPDRFFIRRRLVLGIAATPLALAGPALAAKPRVVTILGDSITAGLGLPAAQALPAQLSLALGKLGVPATVRGAGVSGDTSGDGLERLNFSVQSDTDVCVVALSGNDLLQGLDPKTTLANLSGIVRRLQARRVSVVLAGIAAPRAVGAGYARDFNAVFPQVARAYHAPLYPDLMAGVGPALRQGDGLHPNAAGVKAMVAGLAPLVVRALRSRK
ncbi:MAG TPA: arylesterase [Caulobacteraceae bacterium]|jgi:acyl-CoA thioesterase-1|nr:arylesterase [Caulobacteraceae bacterium]